MEDDTEDSKKEHTGETPGQEECNIASIGNTYAKKGWTDDTNGENGGDGGGGSGLSNGQSYVVLLSLPVSNASRMKARALFSESCSMISNKNNLRCWLPQLSRVLTSSPTLLPSHPMIVY